MPAPQIPFLTLALAASIAAPAAAQSHSVSVKTKSHAEVFAVSPPLAACIQAIPAGTPVGAGFALAASSGISQSNLAMQVAGDEVFLQADGGAGGAALPPANAGSATSPGALASDWITFELTFSAPQPTTGKLVLDADNWATTLYTGTAQAATAIYADGQLEISPVFYGATRREIPITVGPNGKTVEFRIYTAALIHNPLIHSFSVDARVAFEPDTVVTSAPSGCAKLTAGNESGVLHLGVDSNLVGGQAYLLVGADLMPAPFALFGCNLLVDPVAVVGAIPLDGNGDLMLSVPMPALQSFTLQAALVDALWGSAELTDALRFDRF